MEIQPLITKKITSNFTQMLLVSIAVLLIIALVKYNWNRRRLYLMAAKFPGPLALPIIGNANRFMGSPESTLKAIYDFGETYQHLARFWLGPHLVFPVQRPEHLEIVLTSPKCLAKHSVYKFLDPLIGEGLLHAPVVKWKKNRKFITPAFNTKILNSFVRVFAEQALVLEDVLQSHVLEDIDIFHYMEKCTLDTLCETAMGTKLDSQRTESKIGTYISRMLQIVTNRVFKVWYHPEFIFYNSPMGREFTRLLEKYSQFTDAIIKQRKTEYLQRKFLDRNCPQAEIDEDPNKMRTFFDLLMELSESGANFTDQELIDEVNTFLIAGSDTSAVMLSFCFVMLGMHPDVQEKVYAEVINILGPDRPVDIEDLPNFKYTERMIMETLRLFPVGPVMIREIEEDINIEDHILPGGSAIAILVLNTHRNAKYWPDPLKFDPNRFLPEEVAKRHSFTYMPFSAGPRMCIGKKYGMMTMKVILAHIVRRYSMTTPYKTVGEIRLQQDVILKPTTGFKLRLHLR